MKTNVKKTVWNMLLLAVILVLTGCPMGQVGGDFYLSIESEDVNFANMWSDGTTLWVAMADSGNAKIYAYNMSDKTRDKSKDFDTLSAANNTNPQGIWSDGTTMWVADDADNNIYAYNMETKEYVSIDIEVDGDGVEVDEEGFDDDGNKITTTTTKHPSDFDLTNAGTSPRGIWSDGTTMWVADAADSKIYAYNMDTAEGTTRVSVDVPDENGAVDGNGEIIVTTTYPSDFDTLSAAGNTSPRGMWSDGTTMWVADAGNNIYAYKIEDKSYSANLSFSINSSSSGGIWSDGTTMWVGGTNKLFAYTISTDENAESTGERNPSKDFNTPFERGDVSPTALWSDGTTMWVADYNDTDNGTIYAYGMDSRRRDPAKDFGSLHNKNDNPSGLWSNGETMWVADNADAKIYAYRMTFSDDGYYLSTPRDPLKDIDTLINAGNANPTGIWSTGPTMWVADSVDAKIYAYKRYNGERDEEKDFNTLKGAGNTSPTNMWSDKITLWVLDSVDAKIYAYNIKR